MSEMTASFPIRNGGAPPEYGEAAEPVRLRGLVCRIGNAPSDRRQLAIP